MKKLLLPLFLIVLGGIGYYFFNLTKKMEAPTFVKMENIKLEKMDIGGEEKFNFLFKADAFFTNPNDVGITVSSIDLDAFINDKKTTRIQQKINKRIPKQDVFSLPVTFQINLPQKSIFKQIGSLIDGALHDKPMILRFKGNVKIHMMGIDVPIPVDYSYPYKLKDFI